MWSVILAIVIIVLIWMIVRDGEHPLDKVQGPKRYPVIGSMLEFMLATPRSLFEKSEEFANTYEDRYVIQIFKRRILHVYKPSDVEAILSHSRNITKSKPYTFLQPWLGTGLLLSTGSKWHKRRKILTPTFHFNILKSFAVVFEEKTKNFVQELKEKKGEELDVFPLVSDVTLYAICETAMGAQLDHDKSKATVEYKQAILDIGRLLFKRLTRFWLHNSFLFKRHHLGRTLFEDLLPKAHSFTDNVILERKGQRTGTISSEMDDFGGKKKLAMLDLLLEAESKGEIDLEGIREEVNTFMFEGHDTTATGLMFALMLIADHEDVQQKIYEEIQRVLGDREPTMMDLAELKYLEAVIKEALRMYPSVGFIARQIEEDFMMGDILVPKGSEVALRIYELHRRADLYPEPEVFKPERFLNGHTRHPYAYVPFSAGPRNCIGQRYAMLEMKTILCGICRNFTLVPKKKGWRPALLADMVMRSAEPIYVKFIPRS